MKDLTIEYYTWWMRHVVESGVLCTQKNSLLQKLKTSEASNKEWILKAAKKVRYAKVNMRQNYSYLLVQQNAKARIQGRHSEKKVHDFLVENGWNIKYLTNQDVFPQFGTSNVNWDIVASFKENKDRFIEVKAISNDCPFIHVVYKYKNKMDNVLRKIPNHFTVFVWRDSIYWVRTKDIKYVGYVSNSATPYMKYAWVVDPTCLKVV